ncbi:MAG: ECF-type sigma factor, partial [Pirellulales bacterium]|nr:ECF-type sigma factor [Pirellulales bacterium]
MADSSSSSGSPAAAQNGGAGGHQGRGGDRSGLPRFQTTRWSVIAHAGEGASPAQQAALEDLCQAYWQPVYAFVRRSGFGRHQAEDLTQDFFAELVDQRRLLRAADHQRGRFRTFLLAAVKNHMANHRRQAATLKRGGGVELFSIDTDDAERRYSVEPKEGWTPEALFNRRWALTLLENVLDQLAQHY